MVVRRLVATSLAAVATGVAGSATVTAASADPLLADCASNESLAQPFAAWGDSDLYRVMPAGSLSDGAPGWTLSDGATIAPVDDPFNLAAGDSPASLSLPDGGAAQSPLTCVDSSQPTVRFVDAGSATTALEVQVVYQLPQGDSVTAPAAVLAPGSDWNPSPIIETGAGIAGVLSGGTAQMALRFTAIGGPAQVDDVFVDPRMHG